MFTSEDWILRLKSEAHFHTSQWIKQLQTKVKAAIRAPLKDSTHRVQDELSSEPTTVMQINKQHRK